MVIVASQAAKRAKPDIKIIVEAVDNSNLVAVDYFDAMDAAGATPYWDVIATHNYLLNDYEYPERTGFAQALHGFGSMA
jgi:hypothetical protein